jgi:hypothetical protein
MPTHVHIEPLHEDKREHAHQIVRKLEAHLGLRAEPTDSGHRFTHEGEKERAAADFSGALDTVAPDWESHVSMGL